ncbi:hypothetical protein CA13_38950 [Planctomycetes bacterium CA13]|uniref:Uncharacterized protein n=1 Tax=Novipirellula herctigrandis TaxID=2527986 RepID=A0A5C5Z530_9BACT|nr:hypothetical protein CA13_38950 [Planctomycetes bacterium CA13]
MNEKKNEADIRKNAQIESEIIASRGYRLADAIGRMGGERLLKGTSPVTTKQRAELEVERYLEQNLIDTEGALEIVLLRWYRTSETVYQFGYEKPIAALAALIDQLISNEQLRRNFVNDIDSQWGRMYLERPHFEKPDAPADPDDPYTYESVRMKLTRLRGTITAG